MTLSLLEPPAAPPAAAALGELHRVIDGLAPRLAGADPDATLVELDRAVRRLEAVRLSVVAAADGARVADRTGLADTSSWLARRTHTGAARAASDVRLATALNASETPSRPASQALSDGMLSPEHARVIVRATDQLPAGLTPEQVTRVEQDLVQKAQTLAPDQLRRAARRALTTVEPDQSVVDAHEDGLLREEETDAYARARLSLHDNADGTVTGHFTVPTAQGHLLRKLLHSMTAPRRARLGATQTQAGPREACADWDRARGEAFCELLDHLPTDRLHGKVAATVIVTITEDTLRGALKAAHLDTGTDLSSGEARRLACGAGILPAVLGGASQPLDLGRTSRLFTEAQRTALATIHDTCAADGCQRPFSWCELHHRQPWSHGGSTDFADAVPLCGFHHRRIHDPHYQHHYGPEGVAFHRRT